MWKRIEQLIATRPLEVLIFWAVLTAISSIFGAQAPKALTADTGKMKNSQAVRVGNLLETEFKQIPSDTTLIVSESSLPFANEEFLSKYNTMVARLKKIDGVKNLNRFDSNSPLKQSGQVEGKYVTATILEMRLLNYKPVLKNIRDIVAASKQSKTNFYVTGASAVTEEFLELTEQDAKRSEFSALPIILVVLFLAFGALVAAGIPLLVGIVSITITMAFIFLLTHFMPVSSFAQSVITMLGLGAGIDYALLMVNRFREELAAGRDARSAAAITARISGRAVAFSGLTVAIAMGALLVPDLSFIRSMGVGGVLVVLITVLTSVTAVPAMLALLGERVNAPRIAWLARRTDGGRISPFWSNWATQVMRYPWVSAICVAAFLIFLALPALDMKLGYNGAFGLAKGVESRRGLELIRPLALGGSLDTFEMILDLGQKKFDAEARQKYRKLDALLTRQKDVRLVISPFLIGRTDNNTNSGGNLNDLVALTERSISQNRHYLRLSVIPHDPLRAPDVPMWEEKLMATAHQAGFENVLLGGAPIGSREFTLAIVNSMPLAIGLVFAATFILLAIAFRSLVIPLKSIIMNTLTVGAAYGVMTLVFQKGFLANFLNVPTDMGAIDSSLPLVMFAVTFGLSMDYEIFLLSRVQEAHIQGLNTHDSVRSAISRTASVITSAALIMLIVFGAFVQGNVVANKTIGLGLAVAVALDATLVRLVLVPAVLVLAGEWNWWLPKGLRRLMPRLSLEH